MSAIARFDCVDADGAAFHDLDRQLVPEQQAHADQWVSIGTTDGDAAPPTVPRDYRLVDLEDGFTPIRKKGSPLGSVWKFQRGHSRRRQRQEAAEARVDDGDDFSFSPCWSEYCYADDGLEIGVHRPCNHVRTALGREPNR